MPGLYLKTQGWMLAGLAATLMCLGAVPSIVTLSESAAQTLPTFVDIAASARINIARPTHGNPIWGDFDEDGQLDILELRHGNPPLLLRNNGNETFTDFRLRSGITSKGDRHGAAWGDYDNDGYQDLFITLGAERGAALGKKKDQLYHNNGAGSFTDVTDMAGVANTFGRGRSVNWVDFNNDGYLDLFVKNGGSKNVLYRNNGDGTFTDVAESSGLADIEGGFSSWADYNLDGFMDLFTTGVPAFDKLWRNNGDGTFTEVTLAAGLQENRHGQGIAWGDYDNDGYIDLYVARGYQDNLKATVWNADKIAWSHQDSMSEDGVDFLTSGDLVTFDLYYFGCREPHKTFIGAQSSPAVAVPLTLTAAEASGQPNYIPGETVGFFVWHDSTGWHVRWSSDSKLTPFYGVITSNGQFTAVQTLRPQAPAPMVTSTLYRNLGNGTFANVTASAHVGSPTNNRSAVWGDFDNDGFLDLYVVNSGNLLQNGPNVLYHNNGNGTFTDATQAVGVEADVDGRGDGSAWGDFNNDGFLDLYVNNGWGTKILARTGSPNCLVYGPDMLYKNNGNEHSWLKLKLFGTVSNRDAIGATVVLQAGALRQFRAVNGGGGGEFFSQGSGPLHFGLGQAAVVDSITIYWPSGTTQTLTQVAINQSLTVVEATAP